MNLRGLSGYVPVRNGQILDYCWRLAVESLLPVCDEVVICDSDSEDGTRQAADEWAASDQRIRVVNYPWPSPKGDCWMLVKWLNFARRQLRYDMQITLDADEVLHPDSHSEIRRAVADRGCRVFRRHNFWKSPDLLVPDGYVCGRHVVRLGPTEHPMVSDNAEAPPEPELIRRFATRHPSLQIMHYGFLRRQDAFFAKSKIMQPAVCGTYDPRLVEAETTGQPWYTLSNANMKLERFTGTHPEIIKGWLRERGHHPN